MTGLAHLPKKIEPNSEAANPIGGGAPGAVLPPGGWDGKAEGEHQRPRNIPGQLIIPAGIRQEGARSPILPPTSPPDEHSGE